MYAITVTIRPNHYKDDLDTQYTKAKDELSRCPYKLSLICELTKSYNLHFHGVIEGETPKRGTLKQSIHNYFRKCKYLGFIYLKELDNRKKWFVYCFKNQEQTQKDLYFAPTVIIDDVDDFPHGMEILQIRQDIALLADTFLSQFDYDQPLPKGSFIKESLKKK